MVKSLGGGFEGGGGFDRVGGFGVRVLRLFRLLLLLLLFRLLLLLTLHRPTRTRTRTTTPHPLHNPPPLSIQPPANPPPLPPLPLNLHLQHQDGSFGLDQGRLQGEGQRALEGGRGERRAAVGGAGGGHLFVGN